MTARREIDVAEGARLLAKATPGNWQRDRNWYVVSVRHNWARTWPDGEGADYRICQVVGPGHQNSPAEDAEHIVWLHNNAPELLRRAREYERLRVDNDRLTRELEKQR